MLYYDFQDYAGFQEKFGIVHHDNGQKSRRNKILLAFIKQPLLLRDAVQSGDCTLINIPDMATLKKHVWDSLIVNGMCDGDLPYKVEVLDKTLYSAKYETDHMQGVCEDGDFKAIRYINHALSGRVYKKKAGRLLMELILETKYGQSLPEAVRLWFCEEFCQDWETFTRGKAPQETVLHVNKEFYRIYSSEEFVGSAYSCMMDRGLEGFYRDAVDASAAFLENAEGKVIARCIIFNKVHDADDPEGRVWRLAERQYASDGSEILKRCLVDALIKGGFIDGYKKPGVDCHAINSYVDNDGNSLGNKKFYIDCDLDGEDALSFQDSFIYYDSCRRLARNYSSDGWDYMLDTTDGSLWGSEDDDSNYDSYHDEDVYCDVVTVYYHGEEYTCSEEDLGDFEFIERLNEYHHRSDCYMCLNCKEYELADHVYHSDLTGKDYCCEDCLKEAEHKFKEDRWVYCHYDNTYVEDYTNIRVYNAWKEELGAYVEQNILVNTLVREILAGRMFYVGGQYCDRRAA